VLCDASILVPLFLREPSSEAVAALFADSSSLPTISDFAAGEFASAVSIRLRRSDITGQNAQTILANFEDWTARQSNRITTDADDVARAARLVRRFDLGLRMPDALSVAFAQRVNEPIATLDRRQAAAAHSLGLRVIQPLAG
jgi:predicted nucleic acid-binding protein